jgi:hypothetical protein
MIVKNIIKSKFEGDYSDCVTLTMTCSKRLHLFKQSLPSFVDKCKDLHLITKVIIFDDSSTNADRVEMEQLVERLFPNINIDFVYFDIIPTKYRHAYIMVHWFEALKTNFVFHLEDDFLMIDEFSLKECIDIMNNDWEVFSVGFYQTLRKFPEEYLVEYKKTEFGKNKEILYPKNTNYWIWPFLETRELGITLFYDEVRSDEDSEQLNVNYWEYFLNYPPFGFQPGVMQVGKLKAVGNFDIPSSDDVPAQIEGNYGLRVYKKFYAINTNKRKAIHLGNQYLNEQSAYDLNNSSR